MNEYPLSESLVFPMQAKAALMTARSQNLAVGARVFDLSNEIAARALVDELTAAAARRGDFGSPPVLPKDTGIYFLFWIRTDAEQREYPVLIPQNGVVFFLLGVGIRDSIETAQLLVGRGVLPLNDPVVHRAGTD